MKIQLKPGQKAPMHHHPNDIFLYVFADKKFKLTSTDGKSTVVDELAMEGVKYWDLVRTGKAPEVLGPLGFVTGKNELLPIHQSEIDISQGSLTQNPNY